MTIFQLILRPIVIGLILLFAVTPTVGSSQTFESFVDESTGRVNFFRRHDIAQSAAVATTTPSLNPTYVRAQADAFLSAQASKLEITSRSKDLLFKELRGDELGMSHVRYEQKVKDVPVFASSVAVHLDPKGEVQSASADIVPDLIMRNKSGVSSALASSRAVTEFERDFPSVTPSVVSTTLIIFAPGLVYHTASSDGYYAWKVELNNPANGALETYFIDTRSAALHFHLIGERYATTRKIYDCSTGTCQLDVYNATYNYTFGRSEGQPPRGPNPLNLPVIPTPVKVDVDHAYGIFGDIDVFTNTIVGINGANRNGGLASNLTAVTEANSFDTDSHCSNYNFGQYSGGKVRMCINSSYSDMGAHEYGHGVSSYAAHPLNYYGEPGAHSEAFSDIYAESLQSWRYATNPPPSNEQPWVHQNDDSDWAMGRWEDIVTWNRMPIYPDGMQENYVTSCSTSNYLPYPDRYRSTNMYCGSADNGGLHHNATVIGKAASLLALSAYPGFSVFNDCKITPIGYDKIIAIWFRAVDLYFSSAETIGTSYNKLIQACGDLYGGTSSPTCIQVTRALQATEFDQTNICSGGTSRAPYCRVAHPLCTDTDNGMMPFKSLGAVATDVDTVTVTGDPVPVKKDYTFSRKSLVEYYCDGNSRGSKPITCTWGGQDGRCLARSQNLC